MRILFLLSALVIGGCNNERAIKQAELMKNQVCACADAACADKGLVDFRNWFAENMQQGTRDDSEAVSTAYKAAEVCAQKLKVRADRL